MAQNDFKVNFIGIGVIRGGTTWVYQCLKEHPQICCSRPKEPVFFNWQYQKGINYYRSFFSHCGKDKIKGEFSPQYMITEGAAQRIKNHFPEVKIIGILRNPAERAYSHYLYLRSGGSEKISTFEEAIKNPKSKKYIVGFGYYHEQLKPYFELFPKENVLILIYEDIFKDPIKFIQNIYKFLGVDENFVPQSSYKKINPPSTDNQLVKSLKKSLFCKKLKKAPKINLLINLLKNRFKKPILKTPMKKEVRQELREIYQEEIKKLEKLINRDLSFWQ